MQWKRKRPKSEADYKFVKRFAYWPTRMRDKDTVVWLEGYYKVFRPIIDDYGVGDWRCLGNMTQYMLENLPPWSYPMNAEVQRYLKKVSQESFDKQIDKIIK